MFVSLLPVTNFCKTIEKSRYLPVVFVRFCVYNYCKGMTKHGHRVNHFIILIYLDGHKEVKSVKSVKYFVID